MLNWERHKWESGIRGSGCRWPLPATVAEAPPELLPPPGPRTGGLSPAGVAAAARPSCRGAGGAAVEGRSLVVPLRGDERLYHVKRLSLHPFGFRLERGLYEACRALKLCFTAGKACVWRVSVNCVPFVMDSVKNSTALFFSLRWN